MKKTLIEFYSGRTPENLISMLNERFDRVFFLYASKACAPSHRRKAALSRLVEKLFGFSPSFREIEHLSISSALAALERLWENGWEYTIDITGGDEAFIAAAGIFSQRKGKEVILQQYNVATGKILFRFPAKEKTDPPFPHCLSVPEILELNGTVPLSAPSYVFTRGPLKEEILRLWNAAKNRPKDWNRFCALSDDPSEIKHNLTKKEISDVRSSAAYQAISSRLKSIGIISDEKMIRQGKRNYMNFKLNVSQEAEFLYDKAGSLLEMYCALCAHESGLFHDIRVGVMLDWNGTVSGKHSPDPRNEVDLFLMRENLPIVISCKNTAPQNEHLYEIMIMAKHYGGYFATPALFTSEKATDTVKKRAIEMGIVLIDGIRYVSREEMVRLLKSRFTHPSPIL
ncbi:MAG: hypothetical protein IJC26_02010 [Clostridia bacterium]|nr:hypothetical protein [Clostridia bacterium]